MSITKRFVDWWSDRLHIKDVPLSRIPDYMYSVNYWLGSMVAAALIYEVISGLFLILYYTPSNPYNQTEFIITKVPYGSLLLATHLYGAYTMIFLAYVHMFRNHFVKAYKNPRELQWMIGVILLTLTQGAAFLGYSMTGDILAADAVDVGRGVLEQAPFGKTLEALVFGNGTSLDLFTRLLGYHIILVALIGLLFGYHFYLAEMNGFTPNAKKVGYRAPAKLDEKDPSLNPWYPRNLLYMLELGFFTFAAILIVPSVISLLHNVPILFSPYPSVSPTSPQATTIPAYPPWFFLFMYNVLDFRPLSPIQVAIVSALIPIIYFLLLPVLDRSKDLHLFSGWVYQAIGVIAIINFIQASVWGAVAPGVPVEPNVYIPVIAEPAIIVLVGFYLLSKRAHTSPNSGDGGVGRLAAVVLIALASGVFLVASYSVQTLTLHLTLAYLPPTITGLLSTGLLGAVLIGFDRAASSTKLSTPPTPQRRPQPSAKKLGAAYALLTVLLVTAVALAAVTWRFNPLTQAAFFGIGLGALLLVFGEMLAIYHYVVYTPKQRG
ncbi:MAG: cytochrome bc complex cytochrome b subunit [Thermoprotei archaeon]